MLYDGNAGHEKGAVVCWIAPVFIRFENITLRLSKLDLIYLPAIYYESIYEVALLILYRFPI